MEWRAPPTQSGWPARAAACNWARSSVMMRLSSPSRTIAWPATGTGLSRLASLRITAGAERAARRPQSAVALVSKARLDIDLMPTSRPGDTACRTLLAETVTAPSHTQNSFELRNEVESRVVRHQH